MKLLTAHLELSTNFDDRTRERCPSLVFRDGSDISTAIRTDVETPVLPVTANSIEEIIIYDDALSRVIDEEAWLVELARALVPGGTLRLTLPASGIWAWLDAMNAYRYIVDISKRGDQPNAALPTGWNRHYRREEVENLLMQAGLSDVQIHGQNNAWQEATMLTGLIAGNWVKGDRETELKIFSRLGRRDPRARTIPGTTTWSITACKAR